MGNAIPGDVGGASNRATPQRRLLIFSGYWLESLYGDLVRELIKVPLEVTWRNDYINRWNEIHNFIWNSLNLATDDRYCRTDGHVVVLIQKLLDLPLFPLSERTWSIIVGDWVHRLRIIEKGKTLFTTDYEPPHENNIEFNRHAHEFSYVWDDPGPLVERGETSDSTLPATIVSPPAEPLHVDLPKILRRLVDAFWDFTNWSKSPPEAKLSELCYQVWPEEFSADPLRVLAVLFGPTNTRLNNKLAEQKVPVSFHRKGDYLEIHDRRK